MGQIMDKEEDGGYRGSDSLRLSLTLRQSSRTYHYRALRPSFRVVPCCFCCKRTLLSFPLCKHDISDFRRRLKEVERVRTSTACWQRYGLSSSLTHGNDLHNICRIHTAESHRLPCRMHRHSQTSTHTIMSYFLVEPLQSKIDRAKR